MAASVLCPEEEETGIYLIRIITYLNGFSRSDAGATAKPNIFEDDPYFFIHINIQGVDKIL